MTQEQLETVPENNGESVEYQLFIDKFKPKKTTDDCYTPPNVYAAIRDWAVRTYGLEGRQILRPFYHGGDYKRDTYPDGCVVIDNPPFSIVSEICTFYKMHGIDFFLFAPSLTQFGICRGEINYIVTGSDILRKKSPKGGEPMAGTNFWHFRNDLEDGNRVLEIYGTIAEESWFDDDVTPTIFREQLNAGSGPITVYINSPGGDCIAASQIYTMLTEYPAPVTVKIDGIAASAASVIAMSGDTVLMSPTAMMMIHDPLTECVGNVRDMKHAIKVLEEVKESIINAYKKKCKCTRDEISSMMERETWLNAKKAVELGFADGLIGCEASALDVMTPVLFENRIMGEKVLNKLQATYTAPRGRDVRELKQELRKNKKFI